MRKRALDCAKAISNGGTTMGLFSGGRRRVEQQLLESAEAQCRAMGVSPSDARTSASELLQRGIALAKASRRYGAGPLGVAMLNERSGFWFDYFNEIRETDGVTDDDIRLWWNLDEVERQMVGIGDEVAQLACCISAKRQGLTDADAGAKVRATFPMYGVPEHMNSSFDGRRLLPFELKDRVMRWLERHSAGLAPPRMPWDEYEMFNDWVRHTVAHGQL